MAIKKPLVIGSDGLVQQLQSSDTINVSDDSVVFTDITANNASSTKHGYLPKLSNNSSQFLNGQGNWTTPSGIANAYIAQAFTAQTSVTVTHNFGGYPAVQVIDSNGYQIHALNVQNTSINAFVVTFSESTTGTIIATLGSPQLQTYLSSANNYTGLISDYFVEITASGKTFTLPTAVGNTGKQYEVVNTSAGALTVNTTSSQTISGALTYNLNAGSALRLFSNGANWLISSAYYVPSGWFDITPIWAKDDGNNGWTITTVTGNRLALTANSTNALKQIIFAYHIPHTILLNQSDGNIFIHPHIEFPNTNAGNAVLTYRIFAALRDGAFSTEFTLTQTITPSSYAANRNNVIDIAMPTGLAAYLVPDAIFTIGVERNRGANATDTYASSIYLHTVDLHVQGDGKLTTSKDFGTGWIKV